MNLRVPARRHLGEQYANYDQDRFVNDDRAKHLRIPYLSCSEKTAGNNNHRAGARFHSRILSEHLESLYHKECAKSHNISSRYIGETGPMDGAIEKCNTIDQQDAAITASTVHPDMGNAGYRRYAQMAHSSGEKNVIMHESN